MHKLEALKILCLSATEQIKHLNDNPHKQSRLIDAVSVIREIVNQESDTQFLRKPLTPSDLHG